MPISINLVLQWFSLFDAIRNHNLDSLVITYCSLDNWHCDKPYYNKPLCHHFKSLKRMSPYRLKRMSPNIQVQLILTLLFQNILSISILSKVICLKWSKALSAFLRMTQTYIGKIKVPSEAYLEVVLDEELSFEYHVVSKLSTAIRMIENVQRRVNGIKGQRYDCRLKMLDLSTLNFHRLTGDIMETFGMVNEKAGHDNSISNRILTTDTLGAIFISSKTKS